MYKVKHIHFIGIGGIGMSGIAKLVRAQQYTVSGCDQSTNENILSLKESGCDIASQHNSSICQSKDIDVIVYSSAIPLNHPELVHAQKNNIPVVQRATMLAELMKTKTSIGVAGSHGKTTTSSMISHILLQEKVDPTISIGGNLATIHSNAHFGTSNFFVAETDESDRSLLQLPASIAVLTNIDFEHPDQYKDLEDVSNTFKKFLDQLPFYGVAIVCNDDANAASIIPTIKAKTITYGTTPQATVQATNINLFHDHSSCDIINHATGETIQNMIIPMPGHHNLLNAVGALTATHYLDITMKNAAQHIATFPGVDRRFTFKGATKDNIEVFDDYGHHPTEIKCTLQAAKKRSLNNLVVVFQPQRYTRTKYLWEEFIHVLSTSDETHLIITDIYAASESPIEGITSQNLVEDLQRRAPHKSISYCPATDNFSAIENHLAGILQSKDLLLFLGAGKVNQLAKKYI